jgi:hypothetical protein
MRRSTMPAWPWVVIALLGGGAGAFYYYQARGFAPGDLVAADSVTTHSDTAAAPRADTAGAIPRPSEPARPPVAPASGAGPPSRPAAPPPAPAPLAAPADSGAVRIVNLPRGSNVLIDERPVTEPVTRLPIGQHVIAISAPRFQFHAETVRVEPGQVTEVSPTLTPLGEALQRRQQAAQRTPSCAPGPGYNVDGSCFDERPRPVAPPFVPVPDDVEGEPGPSTLWVRVSAEGKTMEVRRLRPSNDAAFERDARAFAMEMAWQPAMKGGTPVEAWTQMIFRPQP